MWQYGSMRHFQQSMHQPTPAAQSTYDLLLGMRGVAVTLLFLDLTDPNHPVAQIPGFVEAIGSTSLTLGLAAPLPRLESRTRFGVEVMAGPGILRFQSSAFSPAEERATRLELTLPRQIESIQRRKFSRAPVSMAVAFANASDSPAQGGASGGVGHSLDLSGGGMRMTTPTPLVPRQRLYLSFNTPDDASYRGLSAKVIRSQSNGSHQIAALQFVGLEAATESQLVRTVFRLQVKSNGLHQ
jgi:hypothetical protein